jgi:hypothetical protein
MQKDVEWYYCHKEGQYRRFCRVLKQDLEDKKNKKSFVNLVSVANDESEDSKVNTNLLSVSLGIDSLIEFWILDSACSYHICLKRQWYETFTSCNSSSVLMGNDAMCKAIGICSIKFRMFDKGALVVMKGQKIGNLYKLLGNTVTCGVTIFTSVDANTVFLSFTSGICW